MSVIQGRSLNYGNVGITMKKIFVIIFYMTFAAFSEASAACFEDQYVPEQLDCNVNNEQQFADFSKGGCTYKPP